MDIIYEKYRTAIIMEQFSSLKKSKQASFYQTLDPNSSYIATVEIKKRRIEILYGIDIEENEGVIVVTDVETERTYVKHIDKNKAKRIAELIYKDIVAYENLQKIIKKYKLSS